MVSTWCNIRGLIEKGLICFCINMNPSSSMRGVEILMDEHGPGDGAVLIPVSIPFQFPWNAFTFSQRKTSRAFFLVLFLFQKNPHQMELCSVHAGYLSIWGHVPCDFGPWASEGLQGAVTAETHVWLQSLAFCCVTQTRGAEGAPALLMPAVTEHQDFVLPLWSKLRDWHLRYNYRLTPLQHFS